MTIYKNPFSHVDVRVPNLENALPFYEKLLPTLGFTRVFHTPLWKVFAAEGELPSAAYFAITENPAHSPNDNLIGFWAASREEVDRIAQLVQLIGGKIIDGPRLFPISQSYYAVFFEDPCGNKYELIHRLD
ncbi:MAG: hypothetical protein CVU39_07055 [Chloroflexi bacterium HGW-Chloroflexi-10]|nr:MAG: hypothetical protein CVU39_07055 [Chloroflexi bacterium HGW-Chloroflexi-10]